MRIKYFLIIVVAMAACFGVVTGRAQPTATLTANTSTYAAAAGQVALTATISYSTVAAPTALGFTVTVPAGWALVSTGGADSPQIKPQAGTTGALEYAYTSAPANQASFTIIVSYPAGLTGNQSISSSALYRAPTVNINIPQIILTGIAGPAVTAPVISAQPSSVTTTAGQTVGFSITASGNPTPTYQWRKGGSALAGQTAASLSLISVAAADAGSYDVVVTNSAGSVTSNPASLTVNSAPTILIQPVNVTVTQGQNAVFSVVASGAPAPSYQWRKSGVAISGATGATLSLTAVATAAAGSYDVIVTNVVNTVTSRAVTLTVNAPVAGAPVISSQPVSQIANVGTPVMLSVTATSETTLSYQWRRDEVTIVGATSATLTLSGANAISGSYTVAVSNTAGTTISAAAVVQFNDPLTGAKPVITQQPVGGVVTAGTSTTLVVSAFGPGGLTYQWFKDGIAIGGATATELSLASVTPVAGGSYRVAITNAGGTTTSGAAVLTVGDRAVAPVIMTQPGPQSVASGTAATFAVVATGNPAPSFQWRKNGEKITGATATTLVLNGVQVSDAGGYDIVATNAAGTAVSSLATLSVSAGAVAPVISRQPAALTRAAGRSATFSVAASGAPSPSYQWLKDAVALAGATSSTLSLTAITAANGGVYSVMVTNAAGSVTSEGARLSVPLRTYGGTWFGALSGGGSFALRIEDDNTGVFLGFFAGARTSYISRAVQVTEGGQVAFTASKGSTIDGGGASVEPGGGTGSLRPVTAASAGDLVFSATIGDDGALTGASSGGAVISLSAARSADAGLSAGVVGYYRATAASSSAETLAIISPAGQALVIVQNGDSTDAGMGTVDAAGKIAATTIQQKVINATVSAESAGLVATITDTRGIATTFWGFAAKAAALSEQRLVNISARTVAGTGDQVAIVGFVVAGLESKPVLIRAIGPTLGSFGVATALKVPQIVLNRGPVAVASNTGWTTSGNSAAIAAAAVRSGAFPLGETSADSVLLVTLAPGSYTAVVSAADGKAGVGLVEVYDLSGASLDQRLANISTRATAGSGDATLIAGLVVGGSAPKRVLVRGVGPALAQFGLTGVLARPRLTLVAADGSTVAQNAGWSTSPDSTAIADAAASVGAFAFPAGSQDAAVIINLAPGAYTAQINGVNDAAGTTLIEVYELP